MNTIAVLLVTVFVCCLSTMLVEHIYKRLGVKATPIATKKVYLMVGIPGSGKSTWVANNISENGLRDTDYDIVSRDVIRHELGYTDKDEKRALTFDKEREVTVEFDKRLDEAIHNGKGYLYVDNTNLKAKYRKALVRKLAGHADVTYVLMYTSFEVCCERRSGMVSEDVMRSMQNTFECNRDELVKECEKYGLNIINCV